MNKKRTGLWIAAGISLLLAACGTVPSVYPYYTERDLVFEPALVGTWVSADHGSKDTESWIFEKNGELAYRFTMIDNSQTNLLSAHLFKLKGQLLMDCMLVQEADSGLPPHYLVKVSQIQPHLKMSFVSNSWMEKLLDEKPSAIRHLVEQDDFQPNGATQIVLTADTRELQKFVLKHLADTNMFENLGELARADAGE